MRKILAFMHVSLDGFVAGPQGEMNWINLDDEMFDYADKETSRSDLALYGRNTYEMMDAYWPTAGDDPNANRHHKNHAAWYNKVDKLVVSRSMAGQQIPGVTIVSDNLRSGITAIKERPGQQILIFGSPSTIHSLIKEDLLDEVWLNVNPVLLGKGIPMFKDIETIKSLTLVETVPFKTGVIGLHYRFGKA
jgi:dihydrofolate reductase